MCTVVLELVVKPKDVTSERARETRDTRARPSGSRRRSCRLRHDGRHAVEELSTNTSARDTTCCATACMQQTNALNATALDSARGREPREAARSRF